MERRLDPLCRRAFLSAESISPFTEEISTKADPASAFPRPPSRPPACVHRDGEDRDVASLHGLGVGIVAAARPPLVPPGVFGFAPSPCRGLTLSRSSPSPEEVPHEERPHPARSAEDGDLQLSSSPIFLTPAVRTS